MGEAVEFSTRFVQAGNKAIELRLSSTPNARELILLIHEALGSASYWKEFPLRLANATGCDVAAYSRAGHGDSEGPVEERNYDYYRNQSDLVIPALLRALNVEQPVLYGHSEGAVIAFIYAAEHGNVRAVIAECPIVALEERTGDTIRQLQANYQASDMSRRLGRYHSNPDAVFHSWVESQRTSMIEDFPADEYLRQIRCPLLVLQGSRDEFGSVLQFETIRQTLPRAEHLVLDAGHLLHRELPDVVAGRVRDFLRVVPALEARSSRFSDEGLSSDR